MQAPSFREDHISQIPALQLLMKLGYEYISPEDALISRGGKTTNVLLEDILRKQLERINSISYKGNTFGFSAGNIQTGIQAFKDVPMNEGYIAATEYVYNLLTLGKTLEQNIDGDKKSYNLQYIDWHNLENNVFHVTEEYSVMRSTSKDTYRPDIVLFVNGIPVCVIECKRPDIEEPLKEAISQHLRNQQEDGIRSLYVYSQMLMSIAVNNALFGTNGTPEKFWNKWEERAMNNEQLTMNNEKLKQIINTPLKKDLKDELFENRYRYVKQYFYEKEKNPIEATMQDIYLYGLCRQERLLDLIFNFIVYESGEKKIARYQQYFAIKKIMQRIKNIENDKRKGGVIWHTQGSGKSLTMVMLAQAIAMDTENIPNPKIILVTDRIDLDEQITGTFRKCNKKVENASTGQKLIELLESKSDAVVTTVINKFVAAIKKIKQPFDSPNIFVLVDEGHRTQYGDFNIQMQKTLPNACFIAMTGTPLMKREKNTADKFGGIIDIYPVDKAVKDKAVVPILYEGRYATQEVNERPIDTYFTMVSEPLNELQRADLKKKFSRAEHLNVAEQKVYAIAWDISLHYRDNWQGTGFKGQLVCQSKEAAIKYKNYLDEIDIVSSEVVISPPDEREGEDTAYEESSDIVKRFWKRMMDEHGDSKKYVKNLVSRFKYQDHPEIIIVVDMLITGFDAPINTVMYLTRKLKEHKLLQAIARVNRVNEGKDFGFVVDYCGVIKELDEALATYSGYEDFEEDDLAGTLTNINEEIKKLPQKQSEIWDLFKNIKNKKDAEEFENMLRQEDIRFDFYEKVSEYCKVLKVALSAIQFHKDNDEKTIEKYKEDSKFFLNLRASVRQRYSDVIKYKQYESQIQKLIDKYVETDKVEKLTELVNIFDKDNFNKEVEKLTGTAAKADVITTRTQKYINEKIEEDPAFYKKFSEMIKETIRAYEEQRINEIEYLYRANNIMNSVITHTDKDIPEILKDRQIAMAFYGICNEVFKEKIQDDVVRKELTAQAALKIDEIIRNTIYENQSLIIDWQIKKNIIGKLQINIGDYLIDEIKNKYNVQVNYDEIDELTSRCLDVAKIRYK